VLSGCYLGTLQKYVLPSTSPPNMEASCEFETCMYLYVNRSFQDDNIRHVRVG